MARDNVCFWQKRQKHWNDEVQRLIAEPIRDRDAIATATHKRSLAESCLADAWEKLAHRTRIIRWVGREGVAAVVERFDPDWQGWMWEVTFDNGRGMSIINHKHAQCERGTVEIAVLDSYGRIDYGTPVSASSDWHGTLGYITPEEAWVYAKWIMSL